MINSYKKGHLKELEFIRKLKKSKEYHTIIHSSGSRSPFDIVAISQNKILLIQVKSNKCRRALRELKRIKVPSCCQKQLWIVQNDWKLLFDD